MSYAGISEGVINAFEQSNWDVSGGVTKLSDNLYVAEFVPQIRSYLRNALKANDIDMFSGITFDGTNEGLLDAMKEKQEEISSLIEDAYDGSLSDEYSFDDNDIPGEDPFDISDERQLQYSGSDIEVNEDISEFSEDFQYLIDSIDEAIDKEKSIETDINIDSESIEINGYEGTWRSVDSIERDGKEYFLMQNEQDGDNTYNLVLDSEGYLIVEGVDGAFDENVLNAIDSYKGFSIDLLNEERSVINADSKDIMIGNYVEPWHVIDSFEYEGNDYFLLESDESVDGNLYNMLLNADGDLIVKNVGDDIDDDLLDAIDAYNGEPVNMLDRVNADMPDRGQDIEHEYAEAIANSHDVDGQLTLFGVIDSIQAIADEMPSDMSSNIDASIDALRGEIAGMTKAGTRESVNTKVHGGPEL